MSSAEPAPACPSRLGLSAFEAGPRSPALAAHVEACSRCTAVVAELAEARQLLLGDDPATASRRAAARIADDVAARRSGWLGSLGSLGWRSLLLGGVMPLAAGLLLLVSWPRAREAAVGEAVPTSEDGVRAKGGLVLEVYCRRGDQVFAVEGTATLVAGDRLRFAYTTTAPGFLMIFGVDDAGAIFPYYRDGVLAAQPVAAGAHTMLPGSVELDDHHGWERVYALWAPAELDGALIRAAVGAGLARARSAGGDLRNLSRLDVPAEQASLLLRRP